MLTIHIEDDLERELNQLARKEHTPPEQLVKDLIASYMEKQKEPKLLADIMRELPELLTFKGDPLTLQQSLRDEWN
jgi:predicted transcriptional regulator